MNSVYLLYNIFLVCIPILWINQASLYKEQCHKKRKNITLGMLCRPWSIHSPSRQSVALAITSNLNAICLYARSIRASRFCIGGTCVFMRSVTAGPQASLYRYKVQTGVSR